MGENDTSLSQLFSSSGDHAWELPLTKFASGVPIIKATSRNEIIPPTRRFCDANWLAISYHLAARGEVFDYEPVDEMFEYECSSPFIIEP